MNDEKFPATAFKSEVGEDARRSVQSDESGQTGQQAATRRTVGVYDRPAARARLPLPVLVLLILASVISLVLSLRFLF